MAGELRTERVPAPVKGMDVVSAEESVEAARGPLVVNAITGRNGKLVMRGGMRRLVADQPSAASACVAWASGDRVLTIHPTTGVPTFYDALAGTASAAAASTYSGLAASYVTLRGLTYGVARVPFTGVVPQTQLMRWDGNTTLNSLGSFQSETEAVAVYNDRLFVLAGGAFAGVDDRLCWSDVGGPITDTAAEWQDDVTGLTNQIILDGDTADRGVALARVGRALLILRRRSLYLLTGTTPADYSIQRVATIGCSDPGSVIEYSGGVFFLTDEGVAYFNGSSITMVSRAIQSALTALAPASPLTSLTSAIRLSDEFIMLRFGAPITTSLGNTYMLMYHVPTGAWSAVDAGVFAATSGALVRTVNAPFLISPAGALWQLDDIARGVAYGCDSAAAVSTRIPFQSTSRVIRLAAPLQKARLHRLLVDYTATGVVGGLNVSITDEYGATILAPTTLPAGTGRQRKVIDCFAEVENVRLHFETPAVAYANNVRAGSLEVHDAWVEYQAAQHRTG